MSLDDDISVIANAALFSRLSREQLRLLAFGAETVEFPKGAVIFRQGDQADHGCVIASGTVETRITTSRGDKTLKMLSPPALLGQMALITESRRAVTAIANTHVSILQVNRALFRRILREYPDTAAAIHADLKRDLKSFLNDISRLEERFKNITDL
ncbi:MAG: cyclic nucleotide-binding domain-containing protein [Pseudomonadota bacterium]